MTLETFVAERFGNPIDPLAFVPDEHLDEARRTVALWSDAGRGDLRMLISAMRKNPPPEWKRGVLARTLAAFALRVEGRHRRTVMLALAAVDEAFNPLAI